MALLVARRLVTSGRDLGRGWVRTAQDRVVEVGSGEAPDPVRGEDVVRLDDGLLAPGLLDAQINGAFGVDLAAAGTEDWRRVSRGLATTGTTAFVPTLTTAPVGELVAGLRRYADLRPALDADPEAARTLGVHLEGPFLAPRRRGAHRAEHLVDPTPERVAALLDATAEGALTYVTIAPERPRALDAVRALVDRGVRVAVGHSDAADATVVAAADAGATLVTHLFNAQRPFGHRDPGVVGAALTDPRLTCGLIADLHHVAPTAVRLAFAAAPRRVMLVTDAVAAMGMPPGRYVLGGVAVTVEAGRPPTCADGTLAGSVLRLDDAVANALACGVDLAAAVDAASRVPADALGRADLGRIEQGALADLVWLAPDSHGRLRARATWIGGRLAWADAAGGPAGAAHHPST